MRQREEPHRRTARIYMAKVVAPATLTHVFEDETEERVLAINQDTFFHRMRVRRPKASSLPFAVLQQFIQFFHERIDVLKLTIDRGKSDVCHFIYIPQPFHHLLADAFGAYFLIQRIA